jgi:acyl-CoA dehydrogenase
VCSLVLTPGAARDRLTSGIFIGQDGPIPTLEAALLATVAAEPLEHKLRSAGLAAAPVTAHSAVNEVERAVAQGVISEAEARLVEHARALRRQSIMVDDFPKDLGRTEIYQTTEPVRFAAREKAQPV